MTSGRRKYVGMIRVTGISRCWSSETRSMEVTLLKFPHPVTPNIPPIRRAVFVKCWTSSSFKVLPRTFRSL